MCIDGFTNKDGWSYNGCENETLAPADYRFIIPGLPVDIPASFGGYMIGDYHVEYYMAWLNTVARTLPITLPTNVQLFNLQLSPLFVPYQLWPADPSVAATLAFLRPILWY